VRVDFYTNAPRRELPDGLCADPNLRIVYVENPWQWGKWYSATAFLAFVSGTIARTRSHNRLLKELIRRCRDERYDCVFQWSFPELMLLAKHTHQLPPIVAYPGVHSAGELRWHRRESAYARRSENPLVHYAVRLFLMFRAFCQRRQLSKAAEVLALSKRFGELLVEDCNVDPKRVGVVYHPIAATADHQAMKPLAARAGKIKLLFISRISVRKGLEQIVELSKRLDDLRGQVEIEIIGGKTLWSNYTAHLADLNPNIALYRGVLSHADTLAAYDNADILLVPSMYEPGGIVVGEALCKGVCVVASDEVGSAEPNSRDVCRIFPAGDVDAMERHTRDLMKELRSEDALRLRTLARSEAERNFAPDVIGHQLVAILRRVCAQYSQGDERASAPAAPAEELQQATSATS
jgi:glycosyltransferase involved in cell wall biosynthesis